MNMAPPTMPYMHICPVDALNLYIHASWDAWYPLNMEFAVCILHPMTYLPTRCKPLSMRPA